MDPSTYNEKIAMSSSSSVPTHIPSSSSSINNDNNNPTIPSNIPQSFQPLTHEELDLLKMYDTIKSYEKRAEKFRSDAAKATLDAANKKYQLKQEELNHSGDDTNNQAAAESDGGPDGATSGEQHKKSSSSKKRSRSVDAGDGGDGGDDESIASSGSDNGGASLSNDSDNNGDKRSRPTKKEEEEDERNALIDEGSDGDDDINPISLIKKVKKEVNYDSDRPADSLITAMEQKMETPPHDLSKKLKMSKVSGTQLFPDHKNASRSDFSWIPPEEARSPEEGHLKMKLKGFNSSQAAEGTGNNTVAIKFLAPSDSRRFSINIAALDHSNYESILFHFNPRQFEKGGQLVINNKQEGMWGQGLNVPLASVPLMFGQPSSTLILQITGDGFDIFLEGKHCARLEHRVPLPSKASSLILQMPSTDDRGKTENWTVYKVWWGHKPLMAKDLSNIPGVNTHHQNHPKKLFISGLSKISTEPQVDLRRAELERAFRRYGGAHGITATVTKNCTFAFVEVDTERHADMALAEMTGQYRINRARRTKHEALMERRALEEAAGQGVATTQTKNEWG